MTEQSNIILVHGSPGVGKSVLATELYYVLSKSGESVHYVQEYIKDLANRQYRIDPSDQMGIFGNQTMLINGAVQAKYKYITCCSSPMLCSFYANFYSDNSFESLVLMSRDWSNYITKAFNVKFHNFFLYLEKDEYAKRFKQNGRYEDFDSVLKLQDIMVEYYQKYFPDFVVINNSHKALRLLKHVTG